MKRSLINLIVSALVVGLGWFVPHSVFDVTFDTSTPLPSPSHLPLPELISESPTMVATPTLVPLDVSAVSGDPYGELYFTVIKPKAYYPPATPPLGVDESTEQLVRLPGSCVVGLMECPDPEIVPTPFDMKDVLPTDSDSGALIWSPDGRYGVIIVHPQDDLTRGGTNEEWEQLKKKDLKDLQISASTLYLFDAETDTWRELYRTDRKYFHLASWSPDGQWIAFNVASSMLSFHPFQADDGVYVVHPDGSGLQRLDKNGYVLGWIGNSILLHRWVNPGSLDGLHAVEKLDFNGQVTTLFESSRLAKYALAPDGGSLLAADIATHNGDSPQKTVDVLALDGSVIRSFGTFSNLSSSWFPSIWSPDGSQVAFVNLNRLYVAPRVSQFGFTADTFGIPPDTREVYAADDPSMTPGYTDIQFSYDNKYLLTEVYEGFMHFVVVSLENGQSTLLAIPHLDPFVWDDNYLGDPSFFSWRQ